MEGASTQRSAPDNDRLVDGSLLIQAISFAQAADAYAASSRSPDEFTLSFIIGRATELALKAYAIHRNASEQDLRALGHNLLTALEFVEAREFTITPALNEDERMCLELLSELYASTLLSYPLLQKYVMPKTRYIREILDRVIGATFCAIWGEQQYLNDRDRRSKRGLSVHASAHYLD